MQQAQIILRKTGIKMLIETSQCSNCCYHIYLLIREAGNISVDDISRWKTSYHTMGRLIHFLKTIYVLILCR